MLSSGADRRSETSVNVPGVAKNGEAPKPLDDQNGSSFKAYVKDQDLT